MEDEGLISNSAVPRSSHYQMAQAVFKIAILCAAFISLATTLYVLFRPETSAVTLFISFDGFRSDFLTAEQTPNLFRLSRSGVYTDYLLPSFPSVTFPNHYTLVTGLYPESHGIVENVFYDPSFNDTFSYTDDSKSSDPRWWSLGDPIWNVVERAGMNTGVYMWPGSSAAIHDITPKMVEKYRPGVTMAQRIDHVLKWIDLPPEERPSFIALYVPDVDGAGHRFGPDSPEVKKVLLSVDSEIGRFIQAIDERGLRTRLNLIVVSDHGMASSSVDRCVFLDDFVDFSKARLVNSGPLGGILPHNEADTLKIYEALLEGSKRVNPGQWNVYLRKDVPTRFHYSQSERIPPIVVIPKTGWTLLLRSTAPWKVIGMHGYDNEDPLMHAIFFATGPYFKTNHRIQSIPNTDIYSLLAACLGVNTPPHNDTATGKELLRDATYLEM